MMSTIFKRISNTPLLLLITLASLFSLIFFKDVSGSYFYFLHDEILILNKEESVRSLFVQNPQDFGSVNTIILIVTFFDKLYYLVGYWFGLTIFSLQPLLYFIKFLLLLILPFMGFQKIGKSIIPFKNEIILFLISLWFSLNTYILIFWHGNAFSLTILLSYALIPLAFYYYYQAVFKRRSFVDVFLFCILFFIQSFALYIFAAFVIFLGLFSTVLFIFSDHKKQILLQLCKIFIIYLPFMGVSYLAVSEMLLSQSTTVNSSGGETYTALQGGLLYPMLMWFSWGIYTYWEPRSIFTFTPFYYTLPALFSPIIVFILVCFFMFKQKMQVLFVAVFITLLIFIFLIKAAQPPFGELYVYLIQNFGPFRIFRSPDTKFAPIIIFCLSLLLLNSTREKIRSSLMIFLLVFVILFQIFPLLTGEAIKGVESRGAPDRLIKITREYQEVVNVLNQSTQYGYVVPVPPFEFMQYNLGEGERHSGQDLLPKLSRLPFVYASDFSGMTKDAYDILIKGIAEKDQPSLNVFPIQYFLIRKDIPEQKKYEQFTQSIRQQHRMVFNNSLFEVYKNDTLAALVTGVENYNFINPVKISVKVSKDSSVSANVVLKQNYNQNWKFYEMNDQVLAKNSVFEDIKLVFSKESTDVVHEKGLGYANQWRFIRPFADGGTKEYLLFFKTQAVFYVILLITFSYSIFLLCLLFLYKFYKKR